MKKIIIFIPIFLVAIIIITAITPAVSMSESIRNKVFRLHIIANSDSALDQELKLKVRDKVLDISNELYLDCNSVEDAINVTKESISNIKNTAIKTVNYYGFDYDVDVFVTKEYFDTREYDTFTLPAGIYDGLKIIIGAGEGHNWWCVMYPSVCLSGCTDDLSKELSKKELKFVTSKNLVPRFKAVELYHKVRHKK